LPKYKKNLAARLNRLYKTRVDLVGLCKRVPGS
jgi:hypothetical protein